MHFVARSFWQFAYSFTFVQTKSVFAQIVKTFANSFESLVEDSQPKFSENGVSEFPDVISSLNN